MTLHTARPYQTAIMAAISEAWGAGYRNVLAVLPTGAGKCLGRGTPVLRYDGTIAPVENIVVGDLLMGPDSRPRRVLSLARGQETLYRVTPTKGDPYIVNESHVLSLKRTGVKSNPQYPCQRGGATVNITVRDYLTKSATFKHEHKGWRAAVDFPSGTAGLPVEPYFLGLWLGDGNSHNATITTGDHEAMTYVVEHAERVGMRASVAANNCGSVSMLTQGLTRRGRGGTPLMNSLRSLGVINDKHVPLAYKTASRTDRLTLLAGVLDSDGYYDGRGYSLTLKNERLFDDVVFVARSLGFAAYKARARKTCVNNGVVGDYFQCSISGALDSIPCKIARKVAAPRRQKKDVLVTGIRVEPIGVGDYFGFEIDGDRLFMLGDFTVTHNTFVFASMAAAMNVPTCAIAHRAELVGQMSVAFGREGVRHRVIGPEALRRACVQRHMQEFGRSYYDPNARVAVASVDTLLGVNASDPWLGQVQLWIQDEAHHVLADNKWGKACKLFPNAIGLGVTATPMRADGRGLGRHADGLFDTMVVGPSMRELINAGYLTEYRVFAPPSDLDLSQVTATASGDFSPPKLKSARQRSHITGDVVENYLRITPGKLGVTFDTDVESATETAQEYRLAGVPAEVVSAKTPDFVRADVLRRFAAREILQVVNVDLFGEGFDLPAIEVVSMARPTLSFPLFVQQFGRTLRLLEGKTHGIIIDHVENTRRHGLPDARREYTLDRRERRSRATATDVIPVRTCLNAECMSVYERVYKACPYCGFESPVAGRSAPDQVDGDLIELDPSVLAVLRGEIARVDGDPLYPRGLPIQANAAIARHHQERQAAQRDLRHQIAVWAGWQKHQGRPDSEAYRRFYHQFGVDCATAMTLGATDAQALAGRVTSELLRHNVTTGSGQ